MIHYCWLTASDPQVQQCYMLRQAVFVEEQGFQNEFDEIDEIADHLLVLQDQIVVAVARVYREGEDYHIGRICVNREKRKNGLGSFLLKQAECFCRERGGKRLVLGAQLRAEGFYKACGYRRCGPEYLEEGCPHVRMEKNLQ